MSDSTFANNIKNLYLNSNINEDNSTINDDNSIINEDNIKSIISDEKLKSIISDENIKAMINDKNIKPIVTKDINDTQKYGDDSKFEPLLDNYLFLPLANLLVDPFRNIGLTPNMVTLMSTVLTLLTVYYLSINEKEYACLSYFLGYLMDCVDGKMARKYNMGSKLGMALDLVSDNFTNAAVIAYITTTHGYLHWYTPLIVFMSYMIGLSYGLNEAISSFEATGNDDFYERRLNELDTESGLIYDLYLLITHGSYSIYKYYFPVYNKEKIEWWLQILKHFGPGNFNIFIIFIIYNY